MSKYGHRHMYYEDEQYFKKNYLYPHQKVVREWFSTLRGEGEYVFFSVATFY